MYRNIGWRVFVASWMRVFKNFMWNNKNEMTETHEERCEQKESMVIWKSWKKSTKKEDWKKE